MMHCTIPLLRMSVNGLEQEIPGLEPGSSQTARESALIGMKGRTLRIAVLIALGVAVPAEAAGRLILR